MAINMVFLPLTGLISIEELIHYLASFDINIIDAISKNIGAMAAFFVSYVMQVTFLSNCIQLLDLPHFLVKTFKYYLRSFQMRPFKDDWFFDLGYYTSYTSTLSLLCLLFCVAMPIMSFFAAFFFWFRFYIEKYNMLFVY